MLFNCLLRANFRVPQSENYGAIISSACCEIVNARNLRNAQHVL